MIFVEFGLSQRIQAGAAITDKKSKFTKRFGIIVSRPKIRRRIRFLKNWKLKMRPKVQFVEKMTKKYDFGSSKL